MDTAESTEMVFSMEIGQKLAELDALLDNIQHHVLDHWKLRRKVLFCPWRAECWGAMESVWKAAMEDPDFEVTVVPLPWVYRTMESGFSQEIQYDLSAFPDYVNMVHYKDFNFENAYPDLIIIQNPYDQTNISTSIVPSFYTENLAQITDHLIYIPWFLTDDIVYDDPEDGKAVRNMKYYVTVPGVINSDMVVVQSENMRHSYIEVLTKFAGEDTRENWEKKVFAFGSPLQEEYHAEKYDDVPISPIWKKMKDALFQREKPV